MEDDVKIYKSENTTVSNDIINSEDSAKAFLAHKDNGNIDKTNEMGKLLANCFLNTAKRFKNDEYKRQKLTLISFLMCDELELNITDEILQKSALGSFKKALLEEDKEISDIITDNVAYTLYIMEDRKQAGHIGKIYSELCVNEENEKLIECGNNLEDEYRSLFTDIITSYTFKSI